MEFYLNKFLLKYQCLSFAGYSCENIRPYSLFLTGNILLS